MAKPLLSCTNIYSRVLRASRCSLAGRVRGRPARSAQVQFRSATRQVDPTCQAASLDFKAAAEARGSFILEKLSRAATLLRKNEREEDALRKRCSRFLGQNSTCSLMRVLEFAAGKVLAFQRGLKDFSTIRPHKHRISLVSFVAGLFLGSFVAGLGLTIRSNDSAE